MANLNRYNENREEMIKIRRQKAGLEEATVEKREVAVPTTLKGYWDNFWYHYKGIMLGILFVIVLVSVGLISAFSKTPYDMSFVVISERSFTGADQLFKPALRGFASDLNGNGQVDVEFAEYLIGEGAGSTTEMVNMTYAQVLTRVSDGTDFIFLLDEAGYENLKSVDMQFVDISEFTGSSEPQGDKYSLKDKALSKRFGLDGGLDDMFLCFVDIEAYAENRQNDERIQKLHAAQWDMFQKMVDFE